MSYLKFSIPGEPVGKARPRVVRTKSGHSMTYTPDKTVAYEELVRQRFMSSAGLERAQFDGICSVAIVAYFSIPKSKSKKAQADMVSGILLPTKKPDVDNILKIICDALNGFAWKDDSRVCRAAVQKRYDVIPHVEVEIKWSDD